MAFSSGIESWTQDIHCGHSVEMLRKMPRDSIHMAMCSPPYYGLRDYGEDVETVWGGDKDCDHRWEERRKPPQGGENTDDNPPNTGADKTTQKTRIRGGGGVKSDRCTECGAWRGQLGLEPTLDQFVQNLVEVGRELQRVLRPDGSWWLNLGDSYAQTGTSQPDGSHKESIAAPESRGQSFGPKNKMLVPYRVAIALQDDGWVVRNDVTWAKPNPMPSSVKDRLNTTTERIFHLAPKPHYWYDLDAIREPHAESSIERDGYGYTERTGGVTQSNVPGDERSPEELSIDDDAGLHPGGKNPGDVFEVTTKPFPDAHFAVYPPELCKKPIKATCPPKVCAECGTPYDRDVDRDPGEYDCSERAETVGKNHQSSGNQISRPQAKHIGWKKTCQCDTDATEPGIVLDRSRAQERRVSSPNISAGGSSAST